ncbi:type IVB secretion system protein IcmH/DotU [Thaumasiovibrio sp. DFM-14]|uniref:type IVB secretion system protein IcmH/DotU n=1 Tax=Thaumasiovibrio sp. DFM-14 TaxID=3384792 RepID=UPI0039A39869
MSHYDDDVTVVLFQPESGGPLEVMPKSELAANITLEDKKLEKLGINPLVDAFSELFYFLSCVDSIPWVDDIEPIRESLEKELTKSEKKLDELEVERAVILVLRYCMCLALDEAILRQEWGEKSSWSQNSLLTTFHNETSGGDKFYAILERLKYDTSRYHSSIEFLYLLLQLGFKGRYGAEERGNDKLADIAEEIYQIIKAVKEPESKKEHLKNTKAATKYTPLRFILSPSLIVGVSAALIGLMYTVSYFLVEYKYDELMATLG